MIKEQHIIQAMLSYLSQAAEVACDQQTKATSELKDDLTVVTEVDMRLSELAVKQFSQVVDPKCVFTEEHQRQLDQMIADDDDSELIIVIDPIDGTRNYMHNMPLFGVSVGVFRNRKPWLGGVVFPWLREILICDGTSVRYSDDLSAPWAAWQTLTPSDEGAIKSSSVVFCTDSFPKQYRWHYATCDLMVTGCSTINLCWPILGRGSGALFGSKIWDLAGCWPLLDTLGFEVRGLHSGELISALQWDDYDSETKRIVEYAVVSRPEHYDSIIANAELYGNPAVAGSGVTE